MTLSNKHLTPRLQGELLKQNLDNPAMIKLKTSVGGDPHSKAVSKSPDYQEFSINKTQLAVKNNRSRQQKRSSINRFSSSHKSINDDELGNNPVTPFGRTNTLYNENVSRMSIISQDINS